MRLGWFAHVLRVAGLTLITIAVVSFTPRSPFSGLNALPIAGRRCSVGGASCANQAIGQMSYSLYLWHWPIFHMAKLTSLTQTVAAGEKLALFALLAVAVNCYFLIERARAPPVSQRTVFTGSTGSHCVADSSRCSRNKQHNRFRCARTAFKCDAPLGPIDVGSCFSQDGCTTSILTAFLR